MQIFIEFDIVYDGLIVRKQHLENKCNPKTSIVNIFLQHKNKIKDMLTV